MSTGTLPIPFPDSTMPGTPGHFQESGGRIINSYVEPLAPTAPAGIIYRRAPGLRNFGTTVRTGFRGGIEVSSTFYCAFGNRLVSLGAAGGAATDIGNLTGTAKGFFARNMRGPTPIPAAWVHSHDYVVDDIAADGASQFKCAVAHTSAAAGTFAADRAAHPTFWTAYTPIPNGPDIVFCDADGNYAKFTTGTAPTMNYDTDLPAPNSVCVLDNFFIYTIGDGRVFASDLNSTDVTPLSFATAEAKADGLTRGVAWAGQVFLMGPSTTEVWVNAGTTPFPLKRTVVIPRGIAGPFCVSGFDDGFSRALVWVADDNTVVRLNGYTPEKISPPDLDGLIERVTDKRQLEMSCYISRGHAFILLSSLTWSWVFDLNNNKWAERNSYLQMRSRITGGVLALGKWLCGDMLSGNVQEITNQAHTEIGQPFRWRLESGAVENFPVGARVGRFDAEFVTGVGEATGTDPIQTDPIVEISWSDDGGQTYYAPIQRKLGRQAQTRELVSLIACTGRSSWNARRWRLDIADPVHVGFMGAYQNISPKVSDIG